MARHTRKRVRKPSKPRGHRLDEPVVWYNADDFLTLRDILRAAKRQSNITIDLPPEDYRVIEDET